MEKGSLEKRSSKTRAVGGVDMNACRAAPRKMTIWGFEARPE